MIKSLRYSRQMLSETTRLGVVLCIVAALTSTRASAEENSSLVLLPIYTTQATGAYGSRWETDFAIRNDTERTIGFTTLACLFECFGMTELPPGTSMRHNPTIPAFASFEGRLMHFDRGDLSGVAFSLRVRDVSRSAQSAGTEIPVVKESDLRTRVVLIDIPVEAGFRHSLRIYDAGHGSQVRLRIFPFNGTAAVVDETIMLLQHSDILTVPSQIGLHGLTTLYPSLATSGSFRIEIEAVSNTQRLWAFVSITNNETQEFTVVTPQ